MVQMRHFAVFAVLLAAAGVGAAEERNVRNPLPTSEEIAKLPRDGGKKFNRLVFEKSPYLLQHARNPVNWYPWGREAFDKARTQNKPVFLSVGYSTCHWCHVMEHESFEDPSVAEVMNREFICIKVDREERPDLDGIYMKATQLFTGRGGWPNSLWLDHDGNPWFAGTYYPREDVNGRLGFRSLMNRMAGIWKERRKDVEEQADRIAAEIRKMEEPLESNGRPPDRGLVDAALEHLSRSFDAERGGFSPAPKFPPHASLDLLLFEAERVNRKDLLRMATVTLDAMALGGLHDHLGGGFHRYSTDDRWFLPHFEKMLYDNAQLSRAYVEAFRITGNAVYRQVAEGIFDWVLRDMRGSEGGFTSAIDADSEGEEGRFYVFTRKEIIKALGPEEGEFFCRVYNVEEGGNFLEEATGKKTGASVLHLTEPLEHTADREKTDLEALTRRLGKARNRLLDLRRGRVRPLIDDKILTAWNGLMIGSLARGGMIFERPDYIEAAEKAAVFLKSSAGKDGRLARSLRDGRFLRPAYLNDYAFLANGLLDLYQASRKDVWLAEARRLVEMLQKHFLDETRGGYYFTADDHEALLLRSRDPYDSAVPSGNAMAAMALVRLFEETGDTSYVRAAVAVFDAFGDALRGAPWGTQRMLHALAVLEDLRHRPEKVSNPNGLKPDARKQTGPVVIEAFTSHLTQAPGSTFHVALRLTLDEGWHINSSAPLEDHLIPTRVSLRVEAPLSSRPPAYPEGVTRKISFNPDPMSLYVGETLIFVAVTVAPEAVPADRTCTVSLRFQACNNIACIAPEVVTLILPVRIVTKTNRSGTRFPEIFQHRKE